MIFDRHANLKYNFGQGSTNTDPFKSSVINPLRLEQKWLAKRNYVKSQSPLEG